MCAISPRNAIAQSIIAPLFIGRINNLLISAALVHNFGCCFLCNWLLLKPKQFCACMPFPASPDPQISWNRPHLRPLQKNAAAANAATGPRSNVLNLASFYLTRNAYNAGAAIQPVRVAPIWMPLSEHNAGNLPTYDECFQGFWYHGCSFLNNSWSYNLGWQVVENSFGGMTKMRCEWH